MKKLHSLSIIATACMLAACGGGTVQETELANDVVATESVDETAVTSSAAEPEMLPMSAIGNMKTLGASGMVGLTPHQIRAKYGFSAMTTPAQMGSGTTIAIVTAYHNPTAAQDINAFSAAAGLPGCTVVQTVVNSATRNINTPMRGAAGSGCRFQTVNINSSGTPAYEVTRRGIMESVPGVDTRWQFESSMDIEWAHAIAPMANIVLVQANAPFPTALAAAVRYASSIADVVSMSWGQFESSFAAPCGTIYNRTTKKFELADPACTLYSNTQNILFGPANPRLPNGSINYTAGGWDTQAFSNPNATYVAASGDWGYRPIWPAVSNKVLAVGGTNNAGPNETGWSGSGGGVATYYPRPAHQSSLGYNTRAVPDVAMGADSKSPVAIYITPSATYPDTACVKANGASKCGWYAGYGTSAAAPQWAGLVAITKAVRKEQFKSNIDFIPALYAAANTPGQYSGLFNDVTLGNNGYSAKVGFDLVTGFGTPNVEALVRYLGDQ